ncbi:MAG: hypothetical protein N4A74_00230, partial [Carboxylicivirga sp.]|nr:hypothetical protein [Carboxylicivirga sp.]
MRQFIFIIILLLTSISVSSQYYSSGADPADVQWRQIKSKVFRVVYPEEFEGEAKRFIAMLDSLYEYGAYALDHTPKPIDVLIHSRSAYSNGFVSWAPKRMEIYPTPHQDMFAQDWLQQLAIHEFRHVVQIDKLNQGFTKLLTYPFGQQAIGAVLGLYAPLWFLEGDAVLTETTLSESGRGRRPSFEQEIRAQVLEKEIYNYDKAYFGSYKDYVPNHYNMGYLMVAGARHKYGADVWEKALDEAAKKPWSVTPFNRGIKKVSGKNKVPLYNEVFNDWKIRWQNQSDSLPPASIKYITKRDNRYKNYRYPTPINDSLLIAEVNGPGELNHFALINTRSGKEKKLLVTASRSREPFSYSNEMLVWTELEQHPRWENQVFSVIRSYNLTSGKQKKVTFTSRYKAPALSPDGNTIAVSHTSYSNEHSIHLLDAVTGEVFKEIATPNNAYPFTPSWNTEGDELVMILLDNNGKRISFLNTTSSQWSDLTKAGFTEIRFPKYHRNHIYFTGSYSGIENIYRISKTGGELEKISESKFGATYASIANNRMYFQDYTSDGYLIAAANYNELDATPYKMEQLPIEPYINKLQKEEKGLPQLTNLPTEQYTSKKYSKWNLFNFHSWAPAYVNINDPEIKTGISVMSQNLLGTTVTSIGFNADQQYSREKFNFNIAYRAWWPVLNLEFKAGNEKVNGTYINENETYIFRYDAKPNHYQLDFDLELPINLSRGKY